VQRGIKANELNQCRVAEGAAERAHREPALRPEDLVRGKAAVVVADLPFQLHLAAFQ
jgi:hypothetical protein